MKEKEARRKPAKETLRTNIKDYIQKQIAAGVYRPGDRIVETQLAREMNVSQAPVRDAGRTAVLRPFCAGSGAEGD